MRQTGNKRDTADNIRIDPQCQVVQKAPSSSPDHFGAPFKTSEQETTKRTLNNRAEPLRYCTELTWMSGQIKQISKVLECAPCKTKNTREEAIRARGRVNFMVGGGASPTNPEKGCSKKRKKNHSGHPINLPTGDKT